MRLFTLFRDLSTAAAVAGALLAASPALAAGTDGQRGIEQALANAQQEKKGVTLYVQGQPVSGGVLRIEAGQWVELRSQQFGRITVRLDRIDGVAQP